MTDDALRRYELAVWKALVGSRVGVALRYRSAKQEGVVDDLERIWAAAARGPHDVWVGALGSREVPRA